MRNPPNYQPQVNEDPAEQPQTPQNTRPETRKKALNIVLKFVVCLYILDVLPLCTMFVDFIVQLDALKLNRFRKFDPIWFMSANLKADPIMEIQIVDNGSICPSGFQPLKLGDWPGTIAGCLCENGDLHGTSCAQVSSPKCKTDIPSTYPLEIYEWESSVLCVKRAVLGTDYVKEAQCSSGYRECYPGGCFKGDCPITKLEMTSSFSGETTNNKFNNKEKYLLSTRAQGELPLINVKITFGDIPCFSQGLFNQNIKNFSYPLSAAAQKKECDKYGTNSQFSTKLDTQTAYDTLTENPIPYSVINLPNFAKNANMTTSILSSMVRMNTTSNNYCLNIDGEAIYDEIEQFSLKFLLQTLAPLGNLGLVIACLIISHYHWKTKYERDRDFLLNTFCIPSVLLSIGGLLWCWSVYPSFKTIKEVFEGYDSLGCFAGGQGSLVVSEYLENIKKLEVSVWINFAPVVLSGLHVLILIVLYLVKKIFKN